VRRRRHRLRTFLLLVGAIALAALLIEHAVGSSVSPLRARIVAMAQGQLGYRTDPQTTYCNRFSAYWDAGVDDCGNADRDEQWCADFAAWVWKQAGADVSYKLAPGYLNADSASFYVWGVDHGTWHPAGSGYTPQPGDVAVYGLSLSSVTADHVAIVTGATSRPDAPDVINGDGDRTGFSVVETGTDQKYADVHGHGGPLSGYVSPLAPSQS
jgi:CHAP domain